MNKFRIKNKRIGLISLYTFYKIKSQLLKSRILFLNFIYHFFKNFEDNSSDKDDFSILIFPASVSITQESSLSFNSITFPCIPLLVITLSPLFKELMKFFSFFGVFAGVIL